MSNTYNINDVLTYEGFDTFDDFALMPVVDVPEDAPTPFIGPFTFADHNVVITVDGRSYRVSRAYEIDDHLHFVVTPEA